MAAKPPRICPRCRAAVPGGKPCPKCRPVQRDYDAKRPSAAKRGYDRTWQKVRADALARHPFCACGCGRPAVDVDHIDGNPRNNHPSNLRPMAHGCHSRRTLRDQTPMGRRWQR